jgi:hypothetical protein
VASHIYDDSFTAAINSRSCNSSLDNLATRITFVRLVEPETIVMEARGNFKTFAKNLMQASLALPSIGGEVSATLSASPILPAMAFFFARGWSLT